ncbi:MAG: N-acetyltransferase [Candidatus Poseidoniaceae archaeon]|nr:N-acetyltransferase [Candidatus Poseidoniaceae archaeon]
MFTWCTGRSPAEWSEAWAQAACQLFLSQTGETYTPRSLASLPVPTWNGNLMLLEHEEGEMLSGLGPDRLRGLLWTTPFKDVEQRVVAFALQSSLQGQGLGSKGWNLAVQAGRDEGLTGVRLEVRRDNARAIRFYERRGLRAEGELHDYYTDGVGLLMRGPMPPAAPWED